MQLRNTIYCWLIFLLGIFWSAALSGQYYENTKLPHREALAKEIVFWKKIFAKVSRDEYLIHDTHDLGIIYKTVTFDSSVSARARSKSLKAIKEEVAGLLKTFHKKQFKEADLTPWELSVYQQFSGISGKDKFLTAAKRVRAQQGIKENFMAGVQRSFSYLPHIKKIFQELGVPKQLVYLPHVESSFNPRAVSHVGAAGMWQFMRSTGRQYMKVNRVSDDRFDPLISTRSAARLLKYNYSQLKDWALAITAYNHGLGSMRKAKRRYSNYMTIRERYLRRSFGFASKNFYPEFLAVIDISDSLDHYFPNIEQDEILTFQEVTLLKAVNLRRFAKQFKVNIDTLKKLNPRFRKQVWRGQRSVPAKYSLRLPVNSDARAIIAALGASGDALQDVRLAQKAVGQKSLVVTNLGEFFQRRERLKNMFANARSGVANDDAGRRRILPALLALNDTAPVNPQRIKKSTVESSNELLASANNSGLNIAQLKPGADNLAAAGDANIATLISEQGKEIAAVLQKPANEKTVPLTNNTGRVALSSIKPGIEADASAAPFLSLTENSRLETEPLNSLIGIEGVVSRDRIDLPKPGVEIIAEKFIVRSGSRELDVDNTLAWSPPVVAEKSGNNTTLANTGTTELQNDNPAGNTSLLAGTSRGPANAPALNENTNLSQLSNDGRATAGEYPLAYSEMERGRLALRKPGVASTVAENNLGLAGLSSEASETIAQTEKPAEANEAVYDNYTAAQSEDLYAMLSAWKVVYESRELSAQELFNLLKSRLMIRDNAITVYPQETLGHFSDWLNLNTQSLRRLNNISRGEPIKTGERLRLDFSRVAPMTFLEKRLAFHIKSIQRMLKGKSMLRLENYTIKSGENLWDLAHKRYKFPVNLLLYFNDLDKLGRLYPGDVIKVPVIYN